MPDEPTPQPRPLVGVDDAWPERVADRIEDVVGEIRRRSYVPLRIAATGLVLGILIGAMASLAAVLLVIAAARAANAYLFPGRVWAGYLAVGGIFCLVGLLLWSKRKPKAP